MHLCVNALISIISQPSLFMILMNIVLFYNGHLVVTHYLGYVVLKAYVNTVPSLKKK